MALLTGPIRRTLAVVVLCAMLPALGIIVWYGVSQYAQEVESSRGQALGLAQSLAAQQAQFVSDTKMLLTQLATVAPLREMDAGAAVRVLSSVNRDNPLRVSFFLADTRGVIIASNIAEAVGITIADRKYFRDALETGEFSTGEFTVSRSWHGEVLHFSVPVRSEEGRVVGVLATACSLGSYDQLFSHLPIPRRTGIVFSDHLGRRLYRYPPSPRAPLGEPVQELLLEQINREGEDVGVVRDRSDLLGGMVSLAYIRLRLAPGAPPYMTVAVAIPSPTVVSALSGALGRALALFVAAAVLALFVARILGEKAVVAGLARLEATAARISAGDVSARVGVVDASQEIRRLGHAMDHMAENLERELSRRAQAESALRSSRDELESRVVERTAQLTRTLEALRLKEGVHRAVFEGSPLGMAYLGADGALLMTNRQFDALQKTLRRDREDFSLPRALPEAGARALALAMAGKPAEFDGLVGNDASGRGVFVRALFSPVRPGDSPSEVIALVEDTTRERESADELRGLWSVVERCPASIIITDNTGVIEYVNPFFTEVTGYEAAEVKGRNPRVLQSGRHQAEFYRGMWQVLRSGKTWRGEFLNKKKNGRLYWEDATISPVIGGDGQVSHYIAVKEDVTARKKREAALRAALEDFEVIFNNSSVAIAQVLDGQGVNRVNDRFEDLFGYRQDEMALNGLGALYLCEEERAAFEEGFLLALAREGAAGGEQRFRRRDGTIVWCQVDARAVSSRRGEKGSIWVFDDITDRLELDKLRQDMERVMRHDLKAPLTAVINYPSLVMDEGGLTPAQTEMLHDVEEAGRRMLFQIEMSLDLYKMETGAYVLEPQWVDLGQVAAAVRRDLSAMAREYEVEVEVLAETPPVGALADAVLCRSILSNLVQNAIEASPRGGRVEVEVGREDGWAKVAVGNAGEVPESFAAVFFEKYATRGKKRGTGLGTYSARLMTEAQGGTISLLSRRGTTRVNVRLPLAEL